MRLLVRLWVSLWKLSSLAFPGLRWSSLVSAGCSLVFAGVRWCSLVFAGCSSVVRWCSLVFAELGNTAPFEQLLTNLKKSYNFNRFPFISRDFGYQSAHFHTVHEICWCLTSTEHHVADLPHYRGFDLFSAKIENSVQKKHRITHLFVYSCCFSFLFRCNVCTRLQRCTSDAQRASILKILKINTR